MDSEEQPNNKLRVLSIGSNAISAFFSWRLQASQAANVTLVWRSHFEAVAQYGISFRSDVYGPDRFRPNRVVRNVDEAAEHGSGYDYVFVCIKALPDIYSLGEVIKPVVTPSHTCIIINTTTAIGIETELMDLYPRNMVLSLCSGAELTQTGPADFDHTATRSVYIGALKENPALPREAQMDMTESLTLTLEAGALECTSTNNIEKHQWERLIGMIAFHPISVILKEPNHAKLVENEHTRKLIESILDECLQICERRSITFPYDFKSRTLSAMTTTKEPKSTMYQDFLAGRPLEIEVYLGTPIQLAEQASLTTPHLASIYALLQHINKVNQQKGPSASPQQSAGRLVPQYTGQSMMGPARPHVQRGYTDGAAIQNGGRAMSMVYGPPPTNSYGRGGSSQTRRIPSQIARQDSLEGLEEFASVAMYNDLVPGEGAHYDPRGHHQMQDRGQDPTIRPQGRKLPSRASTSQGYYPPASRNDENQPRQGAFASMGRKMSNIRLSGRPSNRGVEDDDDDDCYVDGPPATKGPAVNPDQVDMLAMTRRGRNSAMGHRLDADRSGTFTSSKSKNKSPSQALMNDIPGIHDTVTNTALFGMGDNRYGTVDSRSLAKSANTARLNSMQSSRIPSMTNLNGGAQTYTNPAHRQQGPPHAMNGRGPYPKDMPYRPGVSTNGSAFRGQLPPQAVQRQQILAQGMSYPVKGLDPSGPPGTRSVTGSASASFGSLGNGSGSHSSSSSRDEIQPLARVAR